MSKESCSEGVDSKLCRKLEEDFTNASKEKMQVFLRIRPFKQEELENEENYHCLTIEDNKTILLRPPLDSNVGRNMRDGMRIHQRFTFSRVFGPEFEQNEFFEAAVLPTVKDSLKGKTCLIFAYGATNSGKSYTIQGTGMHPGIIPRALTVIFESTKTSREYALDTTETEEMAEVAFQDGTMQSVDDYPEPKVKCSETNASNDLFENGDSCLLNVSRDLGKIEELLSDTVREECDDIVSIWVSFAEIYNENIYDLLEPMSTGQKRRNLKLVLDRQGGSSHIKGLRYVGVNSVVEACRMLQIGKTNLHIASTKLNQQSSRSHCIFAIHMIRSKNPGQPEVNSLTFCDLAGLERVGKTQNTGSRLKEAGNINTSLLVLGRCIEAIREKRCTPYRESKLTRLFQGYFTESGQASMIVNVAQSSDMFNDTLHVLKFSASAKQVVSIDNLERSRLWLHDQSSASNSSRITDLWPMARQRWSEFSKNRVMPKTSIATVQEEVLEESTEDSLQEASDIQQLVDIIWDLERKVQDLTKKNLVLETELRKELCQEFDKIMEDIYKQHEDRLKSAEERNKELMDRRLSLAKKSLIAKYEREFEEEDTFESSCAVQSEDEESIDCSSSIAASKDKPNMDCSPAQREDASIGSKESVCASPKKEQNEMGADDGRVLEQERKVLLQDVARLTKEKEDRVAELKAMQQDMDKIKKQNSHLTRENQSLEKESAVLQRENEKLLKENSTLNKDMAVLEKQAEVTTKANVALQMEVASLQKVYDGMREEKEQLEKTSKTLKREEKDLRKDVCSMEKNIATLQDMCEKQDANNKNLCREIEQLKGENVSLGETHKREMDDANDHIKKLNDKIASLEGELKSAKTDYANDKIKNLNDKIASLEAELKYAKTDDFKLPQKMNTRGRKRATADENILPKKGRKLAEPNPEPPSNQQVGIRSPLVAIGDAIRQSPTFKAVGAAVGRIIEKFTGSPAPTQRRTRRKLYNKEELELTTCSEVSSASLAKEPEPAAVTKRPTRNLRKKK